MEDNGRKENPWLDSTRESERHEGAPARKKIEGKKVACLPPSVRKGEDRRAHRKRRKKKCCPPNRGKSDKLRSSPTKKKKEKKRLRLHKSEKNLVASDHSRKEGGEDIYWKDGRCQAPKGKKKETFLCLPPSGKTTVAGLSAREKRKKEKKTVTQPQAGGWEEKKKKKEADTWEVAFCKTKSREAFGSFCSKRKKGRKKKKKEPAQHA